MSVFLQVNLARALRLCESVFSRGAQASPAIRQATLENICCELLSWKQVMQMPEANDLPDSLYYIPEPRVGGAALLIQLLRLIANALGVAMYRAELEIYQSGEAEEPGDWQCRRNDSRYFGSAGNEDPDDEEDLSNEDLSFESVEDETFTVKKLFALSGVPVKDFVDVLIEEGDIIPESFADDLGKPNKKEYDNDEGIWVSC